MTERRNSRVKSQSIREHILDVVGFDWIEVSIMGTFGHNNDGFSFSNFSMLWPFQSEVVGQNRTYALYSITHFVLPWFGFGRSFGNEYKVGAST